RAGWRTRGGRGTRATQRPLPRNSCRHQGRAERKARAVPRVTRPIRFIFGLHFHQPVGNFDQVFAEHVERVYRPLLARLAEREFFPTVLHLSGPLIEWLERHEPEWLDEVGRLAADGLVELLAA